MRFHKITCAALITSLAWLGGRRAEHAPTPEDRATSRYEALLEKASHAPSSLRAVMSPERATDPDMKTLVGTEYHIGAGADQDLPGTADLPGTDVESAPAAWATAKPAAASAGGMSSEKRAAPRTSRSPPHTSSRAATRARQPTAPTWRPCRIGRSPALGKTRRRRATSKSAPAI